MAAMTGIFIQMADDNDGGLTFSNNWFEVSAKLVWDGVIPRIKPASVLEIGSFEGASACYLINHCEADLELHCIDTWEGGAEHKRADVDMTAVEYRFHENTSLAVSRSPHRIKIIPHKGRSDDKLAALMTGGFREHFDMIYIDGSHFAHDVLSDGCMAFPLLKVGGHMLFDDYLWLGAGGAADPMNGPKLGVDAFLNVFYHKMRLIWSPNAQVVARKLAA
jgi:predicted O-methyltransferase YrrM